jgi:hypothetical protein
MLLSFGCLPEGLIGSLLALLSEIPKLSSHQRIVPDLMVPDLTEERQVFFPESDASQSLALGSIHPKGPENKG